MDSPLNDVAFILAAPHMQPRRRLSGDAMVERVEEDLRMRLRAHARGGAAPVAALQVAIKWLEDAEAAGFLSDTALVLERWLQWEVEIEAGERLGD
jgi:hypothetical protein